jgi:hypothetical protein
MWLLGTDGTFRANMVPAMRTDGRVYIIFLRTA